MTAKHAILFAAAVALLTGILLMAGVSPGEAASTLLRGTLGSTSAISGTLREVTPLLIAGIAVFLALRAGLFNIGVEGQLVMGALASAAVGLRVPGLAGLLLALTAGVLVGGVWAFVPAWIRVYRGGHEVITTIMLNSVAGFVTTALVAGPLKDPRQQGPTTALLPDSVRLPWLTGGQSLQVSSGIVLGLLLLGAFAFWLRRTVAGYELRLAGANERAAVLAGVSPKHVMMTAMVVSGGIAGLAGAVQVLGYEGRFYSDFSPGYGFTALGVALLAGSKPLALIPTALLFGILAKGSASLQIIGVPKGASYVVLGVLIVGFAAVSLRRPLLEAA